MPDLKPTVPEVLPAVQRLLRHHPSGCCLHIVLDDCNVADCHVQLCIEHAIEKGCDECEQLARTLLKMSRTQRRKLCHLKEEP